MPGLIMIINFSEFWTLLANLRAGRTGMTAALWLECWR
jgi:hypothetical protein